jgi:hypothetical protein
LLSLLASCCLVSVSSPLLDVGDVQEVWVGHESFE